MTELEKMIELYQSGMTLEKIGKIYGHNHRTIGKRLRNAGVDVKPRGLKKTEIILLFEKYINDGMTGMVEIKFDSKDEYAKSRNCLSAYIYHHNLIGKYNYDLDSKRKIITFWKMGE